MNIAVFGFNANMLARTIVTVASTAGHLETRNHAVFLRFSKSLGER